MSSVCVVYMPLSFFFHLPTNMALGTHTQSASSSIITTSLQGPSDTQSPAPKHPAPSTTSYIATQYRFTSARIIAEWTVFKHKPIWIGILIGAIFQYIHNVLHNLVYYLAGIYGVYGGPADQLVDMGFKALGSIASIPFLPSNGLLYTIGAIAAIFFISPLFTPVLIRDPGVKTIQMVWRALVVCCFTITLRCISFLVTILPSPAPQCSQAEFDPPTTAADVFLRFNTDNRLLT